MQNNICPECKTENEPGYKYCKNCGAVIFPSQPPQQNDTVNYTGAQNSGIFIDGNPIDKVYTFVGKNAQKIVPKFIKINETGTKTEWCWPPFIWGFFLGPLGVAIWFLYRKMYKPACLFGAIAVITSYITETARFFLDIGNATTDRLEQYFDSFASNGVFDINGFLSTLTDRDMVLGNLLGSFTRVVTLACAIIAGLLGIYIYKNHTAKKIRNYTPISSDPNYTKIGLSSLGGTSAGAAALGLIIISIIINIPNVVFEAIKLVGVV